MYLGLVIRHVQPKRRLMLSYVACLAVPYFCILSHKLRDFRGEKILRKIVTCKILSEIFLFLKIIQRDYHHKSLKGRVILRTI